MVGLEDHERVGASASIRSQAARSDGCGASGSTSQRTPPDVTAYEQTSGSQSDSASQAGCGWRHSHSPSHTSWISTAMPGQYPR